MDFWRNLFGPSDFMPHGYCYLWNTGLVWLHVVSDSLIALAYFAIPVTLLVFVRKRRDLPFSWMFVLFGVFIVACGMTHAMEVWNLWHGDYWLSGGIKAVTAAASVSTAVLLWRLMPAAMKLPSSQQWIQANARLEEEIRHRTEQENRLRSLIESAPDAVVIVNQKGEIEVVNAQTQKLFGYSREELIGRSVEILVPQKFRDRHAEHRLEYSHAPSVRPMTSGLRLSARRKDGSEFPAEISLSPIETEGGTLVSSAIRDVTERRRSEERINELNAELNRRVSELGVINKELETFSYSVSHDLRAPLRHIDGFARILKEEHGADISPQAADFLDRILQAASHMGHLVDDLLNLARIGRREVCPEKVNLHDLLRAAMEDLTQSEKDRTIDWKIEPLPDADCDPGLIKVVFANLISNAVKFTRNQPHARIEVGAMDLDGATTLYVKDNGVGFDRKYADKLFGVFQRLHSQDEFEGTGVGLATVQRIIHRHGGEIWAESAPGQGAAFFFTLGGRRPARIRQER